MSGSRRRSTGRSTRRNWTPAAPRSTPPSPTPSSDEAAAAGDRAGLRRPGCCRLSCWDTSRRSYVAVGPTTTVGNRGLARCGYGGLGGIALGHRGGGLFASPGRQDEHEQEAQEEHADLEPEGADHRRHEVVAHRASTREGDDPVSGG